MKVESSLSPYLFFINLIFPNMTGYCFALNERAIFKTKN